MLLKAFNESGFLESLTGLDKLHAEGERALLATSWEDEEDDVVDSIQRMGIPGGPDKSG